MALPDSTIKIRDGALGIIAPSEKACAVVGACTGGVANTVYAFTDVKALVDTLTSGPAVEAAALDLTIGGGIVYVVPCATSAGSNGSVTKVGTGLSVLTLTGTPLDAYEAVVTIVVGGANPASGVVTFTYSLDGGDTTSAVIALPVNGIYALPGTGISLNFTAATLVAGDVYSFACTAPTFNTTQMNAALDALLADPRTWRFVHVVGLAANVAGSATVFGALDLKMTAAETAHRYAYAMMECADDTDANIIASFNALASLRVCIGGGFEELTSPLTGRKHKRPVQWAHAARRQGARVSEDSGRVLSGALPGVSKLYRDERVTPGLDAARFVTARTFVNRAGYYITNGNILAPTGSDFALVQYREVMDVACTITDAAQVKYVGYELRVNPAQGNTTPAGQPGAPGTIDERDARAIEADIGSQLAAALLAPGHVSALQILVNRTDNILSTKLIRTKVRITPLGYAKSLEAELGFVNPAIGLS